MSKDKDHGIQPTEGCKHHSKRWIQPGTSPWLSLSWNIDRECWKWHQALAWKVCNKLIKIWKSTLPRFNTISLFTSRVESVLLYGCETRTINNWLQKELAGCYTTYCELLWEYTGPTMSSMRTSIKTYPGCVKRYTMESFHFIDKRLQIWNQGIFQLRKKPL